MKLSRCDVCNRVMEYGDICTLIFEEGNGRISEIIVNEGDGWTNLCKVQVDICRKCVLPILKTINPNIEYLPDEKYKDGV